MRIPDVYEYTDYREFLRDAYARLKERGDGFSFRAFSRGAGLASPNHLKRVMDGQRNLSKDSAYRYAETLALDHEASRFFLALVDFNQASTHRERAAAYEQMRTFSGYRRAHRLDAAHAEYHSAWYVPAIRELLARADASADPAWIAAQMLPRISTRDAKNALRILLSLELVERDPESGRFRPKEAVVTTGAEPIGHHIVAYHRAMITQAMHAIDAVPSELRDISSVTLSLPRDGLTALKARLREFRKEVIAMEAASGTGDRVAQLNLQLFPLTEGREEITR